MKQHIHWLIGVLTAMVGYHIYGSFVWAVIDGFFYPVTLLYWLITKQINLSVLHDTFGFFLK